VPGIRRLEDESLSLQRAAAVDGQPLAGAATQTPERASAPRMPGGGR
jgi:hypothetical protein